MLHVLQATMSGPIEGSDPKAFVKGSGGMVSELRLIKLFDEGRPT